MIKKLMDGALKIGVILNIEKAEKYIKYLDMLCDKNSVVNLTAIRDKEEIIEKHFIDSLIVSKYIPLNAKTAIDIGTGAGFPGMALAILREDIEFTLLDSIDKKMEFLREVKKELNLENVTVVTGRAEDFIKEGYREYFDLGLCRGVAELRVILEYMIPFLKDKGVFLSQKFSAADEIKEAENAFKILNSEIKKIHNFTLPFSNDNRKIIEIIKNDITDIKYPRKAGTAKKRPL